MCENLSSSQSCSPVRRPVVDDFVEQSDKPAEPAGKRMIPIGPAEAAMVASPDRLEPDGQDIVLAQARSQAASSASGPKCRDRPSASSDKGGADGVEAARRLDFRHFLEARHFDCEDRWRKAISPGSGWKASIQLTSGGSDVASSATSTSVLAAVAWNVSMGPLSHSRYTPGPRRERRSNSARRQYGPAIRVRQYTPAARCQPGSFMLIGENPATGRAGLAAFPSAGIFLYAPPHANSLRNKRPMHRYRTHHCGDLR